MSNYLDKLWIWMLQRRKKNKPYASHIIPSTDNDGCQLELKECNKQQNETSNSTLSTSKSTLRIVKTFCILLAIQSFSLLLPFFTNDRHDGKKQGNTWFLSYYSSYDESDVFLPMELVNTVYSFEDFRNSYGIVPTFWNDAALKVLQENSTISTNNNNSVIDNDNVSSIKTSLDISLGEEYDTYGPCYRPKRRVRWDRITYGNKSIPESIQYPIKSIRHSLRPSKNDDNLHGLCRPGFLIIGAGKCGTSSLYNYLIGHPRVLPAEKKQVHYFNDFPKQPMSRYLSYFPSTTSFLTSGALMTGEAAPGYIPYPPVARRIYNRMYANGGAPRFILLVREPLQRAYSSYRYSYIYPALKSLKKRTIMPSVRSDIGEVERHQTDEYYIQNHLFSFGDFIKAELRLLRECLKSGGSAETNSFKTHSSWTQEEYTRRKAQNLPPMIDVNQFCYTNDTYQWGNMKEANPERILYSLSNRHLIRSLIGRSLYAFFIEWWYAIFPKNNIYVICSESMKSYPTSTMDNLTAWLGLPEYNYTSVISQGLFNVAGKRGYNSVTKWEDISDASVTNDTIIPLEDELKKDVLDFLQVYNQRLFQVTGKQCDW